MLNKTKNSTKTNSNPIKRSGYIKRYTPVRKKRHHVGDETIGKTGTIRLRGKKLEKLRRDCFEFYDYKCMCGLLMNPKRPGCGEPITWEDGDMAHVVSRGAGGSDVIDNVVPTTHEHHMLSHNCFGKPCPPKPE